MIAQLSGTLVSKDPAEVVVEAGGVGYQVLVPVSALAELPDVGAEVRLHTFHYVREDQQTLFGFLTGADRKLFGQLLGVTGIGPKVALAIMSVARASEIRAAISGGDVAFISSVPGIGKKTAERVILDLRDKMEMVTVEGVSAGNDDVVDALVGLGYSATEARKAVAKVDPAIDATDEILRQALKTLAKA